MKRYVLDTSALLTLWDNDAGADEVASLLYQAQERRADLLHRTPRLRIAALCLAAHPAVARGGEGKTKSGFIFLGLQRNL